VQAAVQHSGWQPTGSQQPTALLQLLHTPQPQPNNASSTPFRIGRQGRQRAVRTTSGLQTGAQAAGAGSQQAGAGSQQAGAGSQQAGAGSQTAAQGSGAQTGPQLVPQPVLQPVLQANRPLRPANKSHRPHGLQQGSQQFGAHVASHAGAQADVQQRPAPRWML